MYIRTSGHLGQFKWQRAKRVKINNKPCIWDVQDLYPDWIAAGWINISKTLDDFDVPKSGLRTNLRTKHKAWIKNEFVPRIVQSWWFNKPIFKQFVPPIVQSFQASKPIRTIILIGHSDEPGTPSINYRLGLNRAKAVCHRIIREINNQDKGLANKINIVVFSQGECFPGVMGSKSGRRNRRVEVFASDRELPPQYHSAICKLP